MTDLLAILAAEVSTLDPTQRSLYEQFAVPPYRVPLTRYGKDEEVFVVARRGTEVIYYEDIEEGFNFSTLTVEGRLIEQSCNQDSLAIAINRWLGS